MAWALEEWLNPPEKLTFGSLAVKVADGDSFAIGNRKFRLSGIDAPEYRQTCLDSTGAIWSCGNSARQSLQQLLAGPGIECSIEAEDKYGRSLATCRTSLVEDIGAKQVKAGMAVSDEFYDIRSYGVEEDTARAAKRGIWIGEFVMPAEWREKSASRAEKSL